MELDEDQARGLNTLQTADDTGQAVYGVIPQPKGGWGGLGGGNCYLLSALNPTFVTAFKSINTVSGPVR